MSLLSEATSNHPTALAPMQRDLFSGVAPPSAELAPVPEPQPLDAESWLIHAPDWISGADELFDDLASHVPWQSHRRWMYEREVLEPRLSAPVDPQLLPYRSGQVIGAIRSALGDALNVALSPAFANLYRNGNDGVAWHGDRIGRDRSRAMVVVAAFGERRTFLLKPNSGGPTQRLELGRGDLVVMGGACQRDWQHCVPKTRRRVGPRISLTWRWNAGER